MFDQDAQQILDAIVTQYQIEDQELLNELTEHAGEFVRINSEPLFRTEADNNAWNARKVSMPIVDPLSHFMRSFMEEVLGLF